MPNMFDFKKLIQSYGFSISKEKWVVCPFHNDGNPSMNFDWDRGLYHCFSCSQSGNALTWVQKYEGISVEQAKEKLRNLGYVFTWDGKDSVPVRDVRAQLLLAMSSYLDPFYGAFYQSIETKYPQESRTQEDLEEIYFSHMALSYLMYEFEDWSEYYCCLEDPYQVKKSLEELTLHTATKLKALIG